MNKRPKETNHLRVTWEDNGAKAKNTKNERKLLRLRTREKPRIHTYFVKTNSANSKLSRLTYKTNSVEK